MKYRFSFAEESNLYFFSSKKRPLECCKKERAGEGGGEGMPHTLWTLILQTLQRGENLVLYF